MDKNAMFLSTCTDPVLAGGNTNLSKKTSLIINSQFTN